MSSPPFRGKTLPISFTYGLMQAHLGVLGGSGGTPMLLNIGDLGKWFPSLDHPLYPYYLSGEPHYWREDFDINIPKSLQPVDYWFLEQMRKNLILGYGPRSTETALIIGRYWWSSNKYDDTPAEGLGLYSLHHLIGFDIIQTLREASTELPTYYTLTSRQRMQHLIELACYIFSSKMQSEGGIACSAVKENGTRLVISFADCPFCANELPECNILFGVVEEMVSWLLGGYSKANTKLIQPKAVDSDSHKIRVFLI